jgi:hypothetical protein
MAKGGKRIGAGRKRSADPTVTMRVPRSKKERITRWIQNGQPAELQDSKTQQLVSEALALLNDALSLKANAGGRIKTQIREAILRLHQSTG